MKEKTTTEDELSGFLNSVLKALPRLLKRGRFEKEEISVEESAGKYDKSAHPVTYFVNKHPGIRTKSDKDQYGVVEDEELYVPVNKAYKIFKEFAKHSGTPIVTKDVFGRYLKKPMEGIGCEFRRERKSIGGERVPCYVGFTIDEINLNTMAEEVKQDDQ